MDYTLSRRGERKLSLRDLSLKVKLLFTQEIVIQLKIGESPV